MVKKLNYMGWLITKEVFIIIITLHLHVASIVDMAQDLFQICVIHLKYNPYPPSLPSPLAACLTYYFYSVYITRLYSFSLSIITHG